AIYSYNAAESYALAIALLSDRLRGGQGLVASWPTDDPGLSRAERRELQTLLLARGHDIGEVDGLIGTNTRRAIRAEQERLGIIPADARAGQKILNALRQSHTGEGKPLYERLRGAPCSGVRPLYGLTNFSVIRSLSSISA